LSNFLINLTGEIMRVLSIQEIQYVSGSASTSTTSSGTNPFSLLLVGLVALLSGKNFIKWFYWYAPDASRLAKMRVAMTAPPSHPGQP
jgi:hypothetical protein